MNNKPQLITENLHLDKSSMELIFQTKGIERRVKIDPITVEVIKVLLNNQMHVVSRKDLIEKVWEGNFGVGEKALTRNIYKIRSVLSEYNMEKLIETIPKSGYRLNNKYFSNLRTAKRKKVIWILTAVILLFGIVKIIFPGFLHTIIHRLTH